MARSSLFAIAHAVQNARQQIGKDNGCFSLGESPALPHEQSRNQLEIHCKHVGGVSVNLELRISATYQNPPCSKPWVIAHAFCSKSTDFGLLEVLAKSSRTIPSEVINPFASVCAMFRVCQGRFPAVAKMAAILKTMGYRPIFLLKIGRFRSTYRPHRKS